MKKYRTETLISILLVAITFATFWQIRDHQFINLDDGRFITGNDQVKKGITSESLKWAMTSSYPDYWRPLTNISHMLDVELHGLNPRGHLLTNLAFHIANTLLLFFVFRFMTGRIWPSAFVAALFAIHPLHVESVVWASERKDVLSTFFALLTVGFYARFARSPGVGSYLWVVLFFALGLMSKPSVVTLPLILLLLDFWPLNRLKLDTAKYGQPDNVATESRSIFFHSVARLLLEKVPLFGLAAGSAAITYIGQKELGSLSSFLTVKVRMANAFISYVKYIVKMFYPTDLAIMYPHPGSAVNLGLGAVCGILLIVLSIYAFIAARKHPYIIVGWLWFLITLLPMIGLVQTGRQAMADRYTYVSLIGLFVIIAWGVPNFLGGWRYSRTFIVVTGPAVVIILSMWSWHQTGYWENNHTIFGRALDVTENNYVAHDGFGDALLDEGKPEEAIEHYQKALEINPDYYDKVIVNYLNANYILGNKMMAEGRWPEAFTRYSAILKFKPNHRMARNNLAVTLIYMGKTEEAIQLLKEIIKTDPSDRMARENLKILTEN